VRADCAEHIKAGGGDGPRAKWKDDVCHGLNIPIQQPGHEKHHLHIVSLHCLVVYTSEFEHPNLLDHSFFLGSNTMELHPCIALGNLSTSCTSPWASKECIVPSKGCRQVSHYVFPRQGSGVSLAALY
jgi:hypothetical protein